VASYFVITLTEKFISAVFPSTKALKASKYVVSVVTFASLTRICPPEIDEEATLTKVKELGASEKTT
jgi:hypothetical protein